MTIHLRSDRPRRARVARGKPATPPPGQLTLTGIWAARFAKSGPGPQLPVELLGEIFTLAALVGGQNVAMAITRVCKLWRSIALPIFFRTVVVHDADARRRLIRTASQPLRAVGQAAYVKDVYVRAVPDDDSEASDLRRLFPTSTLHAHVVGRAPAHGDLQFYDNVVYACLQPGTPFASFGLGAARVARVSVRCNSARWNGLMPFVHACLGNSMLEVVQLRVYTRAPNIAATRLWAELRALDDVRIRVVRVAEDPEVKRPENQEGKDVWGDLCSGLFSWEDGERVWS